MIERIYTLCLIIIIESEVRTITHRLGLGHETMVSAVCLSIYLWTLICEYCYQDTYIFYWVSLFRFLEKYYNTSLYINGDAGRQVRGIHGEYVNTPHFGKEGSALSDPFPWRRMLIHLMFLQINQTREVLSVRKICHLKMHALASFK